MVQFPTLLTGLLLAAVTILPSTGACQASVAPPSVTLRVERLTSSLRDAIVQDGATRGLQLDYACVPAGILILGSSVGDDLHTLISKVDQAMASRQLGADRSRIVEMTRSQAEMACSEVRNR